MKLYALLGGVEFEGETLLGIYDSKENAESARDSYKESSDDFDYYKIEERELNAAAKEIF